MKKVQSKGAVGVTWALDGEWQVVEKVLKGTDWCNPAPSWKLVGSFKTRRIARNYIRLSEVIHDGKTKVVKTRPVCTVVVDLY